MKYLVLVESPNKISSISKYLNTIDDNEFIVEATYGHFRDFKDGLKSIDINNDFKPTYSIKPTSHKRVSKFKEAATSVDEVIIATDPDREGEAIGYHVCCILNLNPLTTKRIMFHSINCKDVVDAFNNSSYLDMNLVHAQQSRQILDLLIGFEISPLLWKNIKNKLSAGRCQSPALRLICERDKELSNQKISNYFAITGIFQSETNNIIDCRFCKDIDTLDNTINTIKYISSFDNYYIDTFKMNDVTHSPPPPFMTTSILQEVSNRFGLNSDYTMKLLQTLYEKGVITYHRTDSISISPQFKGILKSHIDKVYPNYFQYRDFKTKDKNAQEAHECIRPTNLNIDNLNNTDESMLNKLYKLIYNRCIASNMRPYIETVYNYIIRSPSLLKEEYFTYTVHTPKELGYKIIYNQDLHDSDNDTINKELVELKIGDKLRVKTIEGKEYIKKRVIPYTEATLISKLKELGIGRPATISNIIHTLFEREYCYRLTQDKETIYKLHKVIKNVNDDIKTEEYEKKEKLSKKDIYISDIGRVVTEFMNNKFSHINDYKLTSNLEEDLDDIADGKKDWVNVIREYYNLFHKQVLDIQENQLGSDEVNNKKENLKNRTLLGEHPINKKNIYTYLGKYGPCIQEGDVDTKPRYVSIGKDKSLHTITLEDALELLKYPLILGVNDIGESVLLKKGSNNYYIECGKKTVSLDNSRNIEDISIDEALKLLETNSIDILKEYSGNIKIIKGPYGIYIKKGTKNYSIPKDNSFDPMKSTKAQIEEYIKNYVAPKKKKPTKTKSTTTKNIDITTNTIEEGNNKTKTITKTKTETKKTTKIRIKKEKE